MVGLVKWYGIYVRYRPPHIAESLEKILGQWDLPPTKMNDVVTDNAANIMKAVSEMSLENIPCIHSTLSSKQGWLAGVFTVPLKIIM